MLRTWTLGHIRPWTHMDPQSRDTSCDREPHLIKETSQSGERTRSDGSSTNDIIPYLHHRSTVRFPSFSIRSARGPSQDPAGNPPCFYKENPRDSPKVILHNRI